MCSKDISIDEVNFKVTSTNNFWQEGFVVQLLIDMKSDPYYNSTLPIYFWQFTDIPTKYGSITQAEHPTHHYSL